MPANKVVVSVAAAAAAAYALSERYKEQKCAREEQEEQRLREEYERELQRQWEREQRQIFRNRTSSSKRRKESETAPTSEKEFLARAKIALDGHRMDLISLVRKAAETFAKNRFSDMHLPFLSSSYNTPEEMMLATALAFGNAQTVDDTLRLLNDTRSSSLLGLAMAEISKQSIDFIAYKLESEAQNVLLHSTVKSVTLWRFLNEGRGSDLVQLLLSLTVYKEGKLNAPLIQEVNLPICVTHNMKRALECRATDLGLFLVPRDYYYGFTALPKKLMVKYRGPLRRPKNGFFLSDQFAVIITNFLGAHTQHGTVTDEGVQVQFIKTVGKQPIPRLPDTEQAKILLTDVLKVRSFMEAARRLKSLTKESNVGTVSLEHIAASSGYDGVALEIFRKSEMNMLNRCEDEWFTLIQSKLLKEIPSPEQDLTKGKQEHHQPSEALRLEVSTFAKNYVEVLRLVHCVIPRHDDRPPSGRVPETCVGDVANKGFIKSLPRRINRIKRSLELDERERLVRSRRLAPPPNLLVYGCIGLISSIFIFVCHAGVREVLFITATMSPVARTMAYVSSIMLAISATMTTFHKLEGPLLVEKITKEEQQELLWLRYEARRVWKAASNVVEVLVRRGCQFCGQPSPFEARLQHLKSVCEAQHMIWCQRLTVLDYYTAMRHKRITYRHAEQLLLDMDGVLPGTLEEAEKFLNLDVLPGTLEEAEKFFDLDVLPGTVVEAEKFLDLDVQDESSPVTTNGGRSSADERLERNCFANLTAEMEARLEEFPTGTRVVVSMDKSDIDTLHRLQLAHTNGEDIDDMFEHSVPLSIMGTAASSTSSGYSSSFATASVVSAIPGTELLLVHLDGESQPIPVPAKRCSLLVDDTDAGIGERGDAEETLSDEEERNGFHCVVEDVVSDDDDVSTIYEETVEHENEATAKRSRTIEEALTAGGWQFHRKKKHIVYRRKVRPADAPHETVTQKFTLASTPSDSGKNALAQLNRLNRDHEVVQVTAERYQLRCTACREKLPKGKFSKRQLKKASGKTRLPVTCKECVEKAENRAGELRLL